MSDSEDSTAEYVSDSDTSATASDSDTSRPQSPGLPATGPFSAAAKAQGRGAGVFDPSKYVKGAPRRIWTPEEQAERLTNFIEIEPDNWEHIKYGTRIQYYGADGGFRAGGSILKNPYVYKPKNAEKHYTYMVLRNGFNSKAPDYVQWMVKYDDMKNVFIKPAADFMTILKMLHTAVRGLNKNIQTLAAQMRVLDARIAKLEHKK
jgi:hypothetical protein